MIRYASPIRFDREATAGRNLPLLISVKTDDRQEHEVYLKVSARPEIGIEGLANETLTACLAGAIGLPILEPFFVHLPEDWIASIPIPKIQDVLRNSVPIGFGSKSAGPQWKIWTQDDSLTVDRREAALQILAFDIYCENADRRPENPNCLVKGGEFRIIDHELCFRIRSLIMPRPEPWTPAYCERFVSGNRHIFGKKLKGKDLKFDPIRAASSNLSDKQLDDYLSLLPDEWVEAQNAMTDAVQHIRRVRDNIDDCLSELRRALT